MGWKSPEKNFGILGACYSSARWQRYVGKVFDCSTALLEANVSVQNSGKPPVKLQQKYLNTLFEFLHWWSVNQKYTI